MQKNSAIEVPGNGSTGLKRSTWLFIVVVAIIVSFIAGTRSQELTKLVGPVLGFRTEPSQLDLSSTEEVFRKLQANYDGKLDTEDLINGASRGMVAAAGDPYTSFMDAKEASQFNSELHGVVRGIGAEIGLRDDRPTVLRVLSGSPAEQAGVRPLDQIIKVNDTVTANYDAAKTADLIRGPVGSTVKIVVFRDKSEKEFTITRDTVNDSSVDYRVDDGYGILKIRRFDDDTDGLARQAAAEFVAQGVKGVILDLRDNGGGVLEQSQKVAGLWLDNKVVVNQRSGDKTQKALRSIGQPILESVPTVVLINNSSASASEIVAGALRDHKVAQIIGETSYGKGSVQQLISLSDGRLLKVTVARWYTPSGNTISEKGIKPDQVVKLSYDDLNHGRDPQLAAAKKALSR